MSSLTIKEILDFAHKEDIINSEFVTVPELFNIYGEKIIPFLHAYQKEVDFYPVIETPYAYKKIIESFALFESQAGGDSYRKVLKKYNRHHLKKYRSFNCLQLGSDLKNTLEKDVLDIFHFNKNLSIKDEFNDFIKYSKKDGKYSFKNEKILENVLLETIKKNRKGFEVKPQAKMAFGYVDLSLNSVNKNFLIELKNKKVTRMDLYQIYDYWKTNSEDFRKKTEKIIIGKKFDNHIIELANQLDISCYEIDINCIMGTKIVFNIYGINDSSDFNKILSLDESDSFYMYELEYFDVDVIEVVNQNIKEAKIYSEKFNKLLQIQ